MERSAYLLMKHAVNASMQARSKHPCLLRFHQEAPASLLNALREIQGVYRMTVFEGVSIRDDAPEPYMDVRVGVPQKQLPVRPFGTH